MSSAAKKPAPRKTKTNRKAQDRWIASLITMAIIKYAAKEGA